MTETVAKLAAKKLDEAAGLSEDDARKLYLQPGLTRVAIVELESFETTDSIDDKHQVRLRVTHLEIAPAGVVTDLLRDLAKAAYKARQPAPLDPEFGEETLADAAKRGRSLLDDEADTPTLAEPAMAT
jgi:hypothetical protein